MSFFLPGGGELPARTPGFGAVFSDIDQQNGLGFDFSYGLRTNTVVEYYGSYGELLYRSEVPASPGDATFSFFGIVYKDARVARVKIPGGNRTLRAQIRADRYYAAHLLGDLKEPRGVGLLVPLLRDPDVEDVVPWSLGEIGDLARLHR